MSEVNEMGCAEFADAAAELALGVLTGRERARALAHLDRCEACRENVRQLTVTGEELVGLLPAIEPPAGFETRVMERLGLGTPAPDQPVCTTGSKLNYATMLSDYMCTKLSNGYSAGTIAPLGKRCGA